MMWIAELPVVWLSADGVRTVGRIALGLPELVPGEHGGLARCTIALDGFEPERSIGGDGTLQALLYALQLGGMRLHDFIARGGRVLAADGLSDVGIDSIFGPLLTEAKAPG